MTKETTQKEIDTKRNLLFDGMITLKDKILNIYELFCEFLKCKEWQEVRPYIMVAFISTLIVIKFNIDWLNNAKSGVVIAIILFQIFKRHTVSNNTIINNSKPMEVEKLFFSSEAVLRDALNRQLDSEYKVDMLIQLYEKGVIEFQDDETESVADKYESARRNNWRKREVPDYTMPTETEKFTIRIDEKTDAEYEKAKKECEEALEKLKEHLKANI